MISLIYCKNSLLLSTHVLFGLQPDSFKTSWKSISSCDSFLSFKGKPHVYLLQTSVTRNKKRIPLLTLLINCVFTRSTSQILSLKDDYTFHFPIFFNNGFV